MQIWNKQKNRQGKKQQTGGWTNKADRGRRDTRTHTHIETNHETHECAATQDVHLYPRRGNSTHPLHPTTGSRSFSGPLCHMIRDGWQTPSNIAPPSHGREPRATTILPLSGEIGERKQNDNTMLEEGKHVTKTEKQGNTNELCSGERGGYIHEEASSSKRWATFAFSFYWIPWNRCFFPLHLGGKFSAEWVEERKKRRNR